MKEGFAFPERVMEAGFFDRVLPPVPEQLDRARGVFSVVVERTNPYRGLYILYHILPKEIRN